MRKKDRIELPVVSRSAAAEASAAAVALADEDVRIGVVTLGCDKNTVDSERVLARLAAAGARVQEGADHAEVIVINTCGFIDAAKEESVDAILQAVRLKESGHARAVVAMGCMVQRYKAQLQAELPEVDLFLGLTEVDQLIPTLRSRGLLPAIAPAPRAERGKPPLNMQRPLRRLSMSTAHTSYLKVSEGCDHTCAFCAIPLMRGKHRSVPIDHLIAEACELEARGVVELNLISQDTTWYGRDLVRGLEGASIDAFVGRMPDTNVGTARAVDPLHRHGLLVPLLERLLAETSVPWFRLFYMYPSGIHRQLVELIAHEPRILPYLDMPIQHGSDRLLERMRRPERRATIVERVGWLRQALPDLSLRTTVIVGFPGETDQDFEALLDLLREVRFDYLGGFMYSVEEDTPAATMTEQVPAELKRERLEELLELQRAITQEKNEARVGSVARVLIDRVTGRDSRIGSGREPRGAIARTAGQALEVDGVVHIGDAQGLRSGAFANVRLRDAVEYDFVAEVEAAAPNAEKS